MGMPPVFPIPDSTCNILHLRDRADQRAAATAGDQEERTMTSSTPEAAARPTVVLVHGAFADSSSWNGVIARLRRLGYPVIGVANPLRSLRGDAELVRDVLDGVEGPI